MQPYYTSSSLAHPSPGGQNLAETVRLSAVTRGEENTAASRSDPQILTRDPATNLCELEIYIPDEGNGCCGDEYHFVWHYECVGYCSPPHPPSLTPCHVDELGALYIEIYGDEPTACDCW